MTLDKTIDAEGRSMVFAMSAACEKRFTRTLSPVGLQSAT
jgi:hypothetical protein